MIAFLIVLFSFVKPPLVEENRVGYHFVDGRVATVIKFSRYKNLIVIPAQLNDTLKLNLVLDTGIRTLILFSKRSTNLTNLAKGRKLKVGGRGHLESIECDVSYPNEITIGDIIGKGIAAAVVKNNELMDAAPGIDGLIGYELFVRFCIQIDYSINTITLFNKVPESVYESFSAIDLTLNNLRPEIIVTLQLPKHKTLTIKTLIDTGSSFGFLVYDSDRDKFGFYGAQDRIGTGLAGGVMGIPIGVMPFHAGDNKYYARDSNLVLTDMKKTKEVTASIGGGFLKNYIVMFDYTNSQFYIKNKMKG